MPRPPAQSTYGHRQARQASSIAITISSCKQSAMSNDTIHQHTADLRSLTVLSAIE